MKAKNIIILVLLLAAFIEPVQCGYAQLAINWYIPDPNAFVLCGFVTYESQKLKQVNVNDSGVLTDANGYYELSGFFKNRDYDVNYTRYGFLDNTSLVNNTIDTDPHWHNISLDANALEPLGVRSSDTSPIPNVPIIYVMMIILIIYWRFKQNV